MTKLQWKNLNHSFRWMLRRCTYEEAYLWIYSYNPNDAHLILKIYDSKI